MADHLAGCRQKWAHESPENAAGEAAIPPGLRELSSPASRRTGELTLHFWTMYLEALGHRTVRCNQIFIANSAFSCSLGRWTAQLPSSRGQQYNPCQRGWFSALWNTSFIHAQFVYIVLLFKYEKLFILFSFPPSGSAHRLIRLQLSDTADGAQDVNDWLLSLGYRTDAELAMHLHCCSFCITEDTQ